MDDCIFDRTRLRGLLAIGGGCPAELLPGSSSRTISGMTLSLLLPHAALSRGFGSIVDVELTVSSPDAAGCVGIAEIFFFFAEIAIVIARSVPSKSKLVSSLFISSSRA